MEFKMSHNQNYDEQEVSISMPMFDYQENSDHSPKKGRAIEGIDYGIDIVAKHKPNEIATPEQASHRDSDEAYAQSYDPPESLRFDNANANANSANGSGSYESPSAIAGMYPDNNHSPHSPHSQHSPQQSVRSQQSLFGVSGVGGNANNGYYQYQHQHQPSLTHEEIKRRKNEAIARLRCLETKGYANATRPSYTSTLEELETAVE